MTVIDIHPHIIANDPKKYPLSPLGGHQSDWSRTRPVTTEQMIAAMDQAGVAKSALVQASTCYGHDNSYVADAVAAHPDRFTFQSMFWRLMRPSACDIGSAAD
jgi:L-fuconolactonase